jgi:hypothetical protein
MLKNPPTTTLKPIAPVSGSFTATNPISLICVCEKSSLHPDIAVIDINIAQHQLPIA